MSYRDDVAALAARKAALDQKLKDITTERDETVRMLEQVRLPVLPNIRVAAPCNASWDDMTGDDRARHCSDCNQQVFNLSALTTEQAESLIRERHGDLCVRYYKRKDGTILTADCSVGAKKLDRGKMIFASAVAVSLFGWGAAFNGRAETLRSHDDGHYEMGAVGPRTSCDVYLDQLEHLAQCTPSRAEYFREMARQFVKNRQEATPELRAKIDESCGALVEVMKPTATCEPPGPDELPGSIPSEQRHDDRGQNGESK